MKTNQMLAQSHFGQVERCPCGGYDVSIPHMKLHFSRDDFAAMVVLLRHAREVEMISLYEDGTNMGHYGDLFTG